MARLRARSARLRRVSPRSPAGLRCARTARGRQLSGDALHLLVPGPDAVVVEGGCGSGAHVPRILSAVQRGASAVITLFQTRKGERPLRRNRPERLRSWWRGYYRASTVCASSRPGTVAGKGEG